MLWRCNTIYVYLVEYLVHHPLPTHLFKSITICIHGYIVQCTPPVLRTTNCTRQMCPPLPGITGTAGTGTPLALLLSVPSVSGRCTPVPLQLYLYAYNCVHTIVLQFFKIAFAEVYPLYKQYLGTILY